MSQMSAGNGRHPSHCAPLLQTAEILLHDTRTQEVGRVERITWGEYQNQRQIGRIKDGLIGRILMGGR